MKALSCLVLFLILVDCVASMPMLHAKLPFAHVPLAKRAKQICGWKKEFGVGPAVVYRSLFALCDQPAGSEAPRVSVGMPTPTTKSPTRTSKQISPAPRRRGNTY
ncbi:hypothetical protein IE81DRAFT_349611 [Ceraceosorus guamensis]|uniref:Secreted protein n=1 Tax=Ceraceosorus guamensis TaxID=1522189 RepID=A0A316VS64_9BASI|nr:hypothetical protein IE81DRAFT_349611 [Ceraceosorus guamensis]PWN40054.1 hypothetical protein IE81DRAFT_349611 [Ceraceosorus guamensis]